MPKFAYTPSSDRSAAEALADQIVALGPDRLIKTKEFDYGFGIEVRNQDAQRGVQILRIVSEDDGETSHAMKIQSPVSEIADYLLNGE